MRVQMMKQQRQQPGQGMTQEQYRQYQQYQEQQQGDQGQQAPVQPTYQQLVDQRNQAIAQAILNANAHSQSMVNEGTPSNQNPQMSETSKTPAPLVPMGAVTSPPVVQDEVDLAEVWKKLDKKSTVWTLLIDDQAKLLTVSEYIDRFQKQGVKINESPMHYVQMIDQLTSENPQMLQRPFGEILQILAIVDYDFNNGMDKDALARAVLGEAGYEANKKRFNQ